jgi:taurine dioxygenase
MLQENIDVQRLSPRHPGAIINGISARSATPEAVEFLKQELALHGVAVLRDQDLAPAEYLAFAKLFGQIEPSTREQFWLKEQPEIYVISNVVENGRLIGNPNDGFAWHTDQYYFERPTAYTFLHAIEAPPAGADTQFCETFSLYDDLSDEKRAEYSGIKIAASHSKLNAGRLHEGQEEKYRDILQPLVRTHPVTGRKFLYFSSKLASEPHGMDRTEFDRLHATLIARATRPDRVYSHKWRSKDLVIWDNRGLLHTATSFDKERYRRICHRLSVIGEKPY